MAGLDSQPMGSGGSSESGLDEAVRGADVLGMDDLEPVLPRGPETSASAPVLVLATPPLNSNRVCKVGCRGAERPVVQDWGP